MSVCMPMTAVTIELLELKQEPKRFSWLVFQGEKSLRIEGIGKKYNSDHGECDSYHAFPYS